MDHRSVYSFEKAYDWNYTIIKGNIYEVKKESKLFAEIQNMFIEKNPWEMVFFSHPEIEMFHIQPVKVLPEYKALKMEFSPAARFLGAKSSTKPAF
jgi:hypothetical protein